MTETPKYTVIKKDKEFEIRQYGGYIQAEVAVAARNYKTAIEKGFNILAGFIFGNNISRQKIAMTAPVIVSGSDRFTVAFIMPSEFTLETLPIPRDDSIHFTPVTARSMAAIRFSGFFRQDSIMKNKQRLSLWLEQQGLEREGEYIIAGYNPPWVPGFLARNEVLVGIKE